MFYLQEKQIAEEEDRIEDDRKKALAEASERMARETREALSDQEKQIGQLIARLQVGQARRQALIQRQDRTIKDLEVNICSNNKHVGYVTITSYRVLQNDTLLAKIYLA